MFRHFLMHGKSERFHIGEKIREMRLKHTHDFFFRIVIVSKALEQHFFLPGRSGKEIPDGVSPFLCNGILIFAHPSRRNGLPFQQSFPPLAILFKFSHLKGKRRKR